MHPAGRVCLQLPQNIGQCTIWPKFRKQVNVIPGTIQFQGNAAQLSDRSAEVIMKAYLMLRRDEGTSILRRDDVIKELV